MALSTNVITPEPAIAATQESRFRSTGMELFGTGVGEGLQYSTPGALGRLASWYAAGNDERIDEETWKGSPHYREGLKYDPSLTMARAEILAYRKDIETRREFIKAHASSAGSAAVLGFIGNIVGNLPDPVNYIPVANVATKAWLATKIGRIGARAAVGAAEATAGSLISQPLILAAEAQSQGQYDWSMAATNVAASTIFGGLFGTVVGNLERIKLQKHVDGISKAVDDLSAGRNVDVGPVIKPEIDRVRTEKISLLDSLKKQKADIETKIITEQPFVKHEDLLNAIRGDVERGYAGARFPVKDAFGVITEYKGIKSGFPEYFRNKGLKKNDVIEMIDNALQGKKLTEKQQGILTDLAEGKTREFESAKHIIDTEAAQKPRGDTVIADIGLEAGDKFKIYGEQYNVKGFDEEGKIILSTGLGAEEHIITLDTFDKLPHPDEGSIVKKITPELATVNKQIADIEKELSGEPLRFDSGEEPFDIPEEAIIKENKVVSELPDMTDEIPDLEAQVRELETEGKLVEEDIKEMEGMDTLNKEAGVWSKAIKMATDCILRGE